jgi:hypothetical protein
MAQGDGCSSTMTSCTSRVGDLQLVAQPATGRLLSAKRLALLPIEHIALRKIRRRVTGSGRYFLIWTRAPAIEPAGREPVGESP